MKPTARSSRQTGFIKKFFWQCQFICLDKITFLVSYQELDEGPTILQNTDRYFHWDPVQTTFLES